MMLRTRGFGLGLRTPLARGTRSFSHFRPLKSGGHDEHDHHHEVEYTDAEYFGSNPVLLAFLGGGAVFLGLYYMNQKYKETHETSYFEQYFQNAGSTREQALKESDEYQEELKKQMDIREAMILPAPKRLFNDFNTLETIPTGAPFNYTPGLLLDVEKIGPRRKPKSIFD